MFRDRKQLRDAEIRSMQARTSHNPYAAIPESRCRLVERTLVPPLITAQRRIPLAVYLWRAAATGQRPERSRARGVVRADRERETRMESNNAVDLPIAGNRVHHSVHVAAEHTAAPERNVVSNKSIKCMLRIVITRPIVSVRVVCVLPIEIISAALIYSGVQIPI